MTKKTRRILGAILISIPIGLGISYVIYNDKVKEILLAIGIVVFIGLIFSALVCGYRLLVMDDDEEFWDDWWI